MMLIDICSMMMMIMTMNVILNSHFPWMMIVTHVMVVDDANSLFDGLLIAVVVVVDVNYSMMIF